MRSRTLLTAAVLAIAALPLLAQGMKYQDRPVVRELPLDVSGSFWIDNPNGNVEIIGVDGSMLSIVATRTIYGANPDAVKEGRETTKMAFLGDEHNRVLRTLFPPNHDPHWSCSVDYVVHVPRTVNVQVASKGTEKIRVANILGNVTVHAFNGRIYLDDVSGATVIDTTNGLVVYNYANKPISNVQVTAINASIEFHLPSDSNFDWIGESLRGDYLTTFPARVRFTGPNGKQFHASVNAPGGPTFTTATMLGRISMFGNGKGFADARSLYQQQVVEAGPAAPPTPTPEGALMGQLSFPLITSNFVYNIDIADLHVGEVRGFARVGAKAGSLVLDRVLGDCEVNSLGGPLTLGEIMGHVTAHTDAGNVVVRAAREGGTITTNGGIIRLFYTGGPTTLRSGGGDIIVQQAAGSISAATRSGDISITIDPNLKSARIDARTDRGNVTLNFTPAFGAEIDAIVITSDPDADVIHTDFNGLSIRKEQVGTKTKVHATGKINGGGERVDIYANEGNISLSSRP